jgi:radical SAM superfamily enzyme YgiQ (UPF0313 family)
MKILFINPSNPFNGYHIPSGLRKTPFIKRFLNFSGISLFPPLNLALLAALTPREHEVAIRDACVHPIDTTEIEGADLDLVGITTMTGNAPAAYQIADQFRARGIPVVMGGSHVTVMPDEALLHCDSVVLGEAEGCWEQLLLDVAAGNLCPIYQSNQYFNMKASPIPRRDLLDASKYLVAQTIETSRGCPYDCDFCSVTAISGGTYRLRPVEEVVAELATMPKSNVFFVDDNVVGNPKRAKQLFRAMIPLNKWWGGQVTINIARDPELLDLAAASGCKCLFIGLESFSNRELRKLGRFENWRENFFVHIEAIRRRKIAIWGAFVLGMDTDSLESIEETVAYAVRAKLDLGQFTVLTPLPGTKVFRELVEQNRVFNFDWREFTYGGVVMHPKQMTAHELAEAFLRSWKKFYSFRGILKRLGWNIFSRQKFLLWVINVGVNRVLRYALNKPLIAKNDAESVAAVASVPESLPKNGLYSLDRLYKHRLHIVPRDVVAATTAEPKP